RELLSFPTRRSSDLGYYKFGAADGGVKFQNVQELVNQFDLVRKNLFTVGSSMYSARDILANRIGITNKLAELYAKDVLMPFAGRSEEHTSELQSREN